MTKHAAERPVTPIRRSPGRRIVRIGALVLLGSVAACQAREKKAAPAQAVAEAAPADTAVAEEVAPAPAPIPIAAPAPVTVMRPACDQFQLTENSAAAVMIGDARDSLRTRCMVLSDSTATEADGTINGRVVAGSSGLTLVAQIANGYVNGIFVTDTLFRTPDGLGPGTAVSSLMQLSGALVLEGVNDLSLVVGSHCGLYFQIPKPPAPEGGGRWADIVGALPAGTRVERVVVRGCR